ncbi:hypothetical protein M513_13552 [Trichuris suis]|uniref:DDE-1 domain-containing protein n=1 Tax=Trichuris suis TaxID=68888 RepID=A0A085LKS8_9BILA|nr:hypothetical protein M513_13552 [Trichuris suis]
MVCANSTGTHRLPLFLIGKSKRPRAIRQAKKLPVKDFQNSIGKSGKVLLLIGNAPAHPAPAQLNSIHEDVTVHFLLPNVIPLIQSMDEGVIRSLKVHYRRRLLEQLLCSDNLAAKSAPDFYKIVDLRDCCYLAAESWEAIKQSTLRNAWNKILTHRRTVASSVDNATVEDVGEIARALRHLPPYSECAVADVHRWLTCDSAEQGFQLMNDEEIVDFVSRKPADNEEEQQVAEDEEKRIVVPTHSEAFAQLDAALLWFEEQEECDGRRLLCLKRIPDLAASKCQSLLKQTLITD